MAAPEPALVEHPTIREELPHTRLSLRVDAWVHRVGDASSWLWLVLLTIVVLNVVLRYVFGEGRIEFEEIQWHLYATGFLVALGYAYETDDHIRVDVLRGRFSPRLRAWIELYGILLLLLPFVALVLCHAPAFVMSSWAQGEVSAAPGGLPFRWAIKAMIVAGFSLLGLAGLSRLSRVSASLFGFPRAAAESSRAAAANEEA